MSKKKSNFIVYALKEIFFVVIGILIAVSINNWNEKRKERAELNQILLKVKDDLRTDIAKVDEVISHYERVDTIFQNVLQSKYVKSDYENNPGLQYLIFGFPELSFTKRGKSLLEDFKGDMGSGSEAVVQDIIEFYNVQLWEIKVDDDIRAEDLKENFSHWKKNSSWWFDYVQLNLSDEFVDYAINSKDYKTRVATAQFYAYKVYLPEIAKFKNLGNKLIDEIEQIVE